MTEIRMVIEGDDAIDATEALLAIPGISGNYTVTEEPERETILATVAAIVGIVAGGIQIAEQIRKWYEKHKLDKVLIIAPNGERILVMGENIDDETITKISQVFSNLEKTD
ncbi:MAG: hypothetical protein KME57_33735 [Scytonema hyalinum WJT4-NPBG1]|jgi:hypothetical protein|nr:hypothetical protein [Scytonema hyalinum WJT4-NPBG1]